MAASTPSSAPRVGEQHLAPAALLGRGPQHQDPAACLLRHRGRRQPRAQSGGGDDVVPAGVADAGEGVVLAQHGDGGTCRACAGREGRLEAVGLPGHVEALALQQRREQIVREALLVVGLGVSMDLVGRVEQHVSACLHLGSQLCLELLQLHG